MARPEGNFTVYAMLNWRGQWKRQGDSKILKQGETLTKQMPKPSPTQPLLELQHQEENSIWMTRSESERSSTEKHGGARWSGDAAEPGFVRPLCAEAYENAPYLRNPHLLRVFCIFLNKEIRYWCNSNRFRVQLMWSTFSVYSTPSKNDFFPN